MTPPRRGRADYSPRKEDRRERDYDRRDRGGDRDRSRSPDDRGRDRDEPKDVAIKDRDDEPEHEPAENGTNGAETKGGNTIIKTE